MIVIYYIHIHHERKLTANAHKITQCSNQSTTLVNIQNIQNMLKFTIYMYINSVIPIEQSNIKQNFRLQS